MKKTHPKRQFGKKAIREKLALHPDDKTYEFQKSWVDENKQPIPADYKPPVNRKNNPIYETHRRGLIQFENYMEADHWSLTNDGCCSFFIKGYRWPWHTKIGYRGLLFVTDAAVKEGENFV